MKACAKILLGILCIVFAIFLLLGVVTVLGTAGELESVLIIISIIFSLVGIIIGISGYFSVKKES